jgi:hypothetical protein
MDTYDPYGYCVWNYFPAGYGSWGMFRFGGGYYLYSWRILSDVYRLF